MGSTEPDRSLSSGFSLPQWMKQKVGDRYNIDDTTFSPPSQDDSFFYIRYPKSAQEPPRKSNYNRINELLEEEEKRAREAQSDSGASHQQFIPQFRVNCSKDGDDAGESSSSWAKQSTASADHDPSKPDAYGGSVFQAAQRMKTLTVQNLPPASAYKQTDMSLADRVSKSLPATPLTTPCPTPDSSPRNSRKVLSHPINRYFTNSVLGEVPKAGTSTGPALDAAPVYHGSWILTGIMGSRDSSTTSIERPGTLQTIDESGLDAGLSHSKSPDLRRNKSSSALLNAMRETADKDADTVTPIQSPDSETGELPACTAPLLDSAQHQKVKTVQPKPSELREMNFWSPTSM